MQKFIVLVLAASFLFSGCARIVAPVHVKAKGDPPGQVQKATGYNPASGKVKVK